MRWAYSVDRSVVFNGCVLFCKKQNWIVSSIFLKNEICTLTYENNLGESTRETVNYGREIEGLYLQEKTI